MSYRLTDRALSDLAEIDQFIAVRMRNPTGAWIVRDYLFEAFANIGRDPLHCGGRPRPHVTDKPFKFLNVRKYVVIYYDGEEPTAIVAVAGIRQELRQILLDVP